MKPNSYYERKACVNCKHIFAMREYEGTSEYFCHIDKSERPKCGSSCMKESFVFCSDDEWDRYMIRWERWSEPRKVEAWGCCDKHTSNFEDAL